MIFLNFGRTFSLARFIIRPSYTHFSIANRILNRQFSAFVIAPPHPIYFARNGEKREKNEKHQSLKQEFEKEEETGGGPKRNLTGFVTLLAFSVGLSFGIGYYVYRIARPIDVTWRVLEDMIARGEVKSIQISQERSSAIVLLHSPQYVEGKSVFVINVPFQETALDFQKRVHSFETRLGIIESEKIKILVSHDSSYMELLTSIIVSSAILATLGTFLIRRRLPKGTPLDQALLTSLRSLIMTGRFTKEMGKKNKPNSPSLAAQKDDNSKFGGGFGNGMPPFLDAMGMGGEIKPTTTDVTFDDVAGMHASKEEVMEFVTYLRNPAKYQALGAKLPKGALLLGPPGTGKTLLVKALAHEAGVPFFSMAGSEFIEVIGGLGASRIRKLFKAARAQSPSIIFIDEIDSVGRRRSGVGQSRQGGGGGGGASESEQTLNQLLVEMDGMDTTAGTIVFAATNRGDLLDNALLRAGRFDRHIFIDLPNIAERKEMLEMYLGRYKISKIVDKVSLKNRLATWTPGMSGADIARLCNEAALIAARRPNIDAGVESVDFDAALERVLAGAAKRSSPLSQPERRVAAVQEAGRALVASLLPNTGLTPFRISIIPRAHQSGQGDGLGFTQFVPDERKLMNIDDIADRMAVLLAGRAAEQVIFKAISDASQRYLQKATDLAYKEVREWGMSDVVGNLSFPSETENGGMKPYSKRTAALIDCEVDRLIITAFQRAVSLIQTHEPQLMRLVNLLLEHEVVSSDQLKSVFSEEYVAPELTPISS